jgi:hypothetical protein
VPSLQCVSCTLYPKPKNLKAEKLLLLDDAEFCVLPLTIDCKTNPFRVTQETSQPSQFLLHAILAISMQHLAKKGHDETLTVEMFSHRSMATDLYSKALSKADPLTLLDTLLIFVYLDVSKWFLNGMHAY